MLITKKCLFNGVESTEDLPITQEQLDRWQKGEMVQNVFPHLNADQREFLMTGIPIGSWSELVGPEDE